MHPVYYKCPSCITVKFVAIALYRKRLGRLVQLHEPAGNSFRHITKKRL